MPDVILTVDAEYQPNLKNLASNVENLLSQAEAAASKHKIKIDVDQSYLQNQVKNLMKTFDGNMGGTGKGTGKKGSGTKSTKTAVKSAIKQYNDAMSAYRSQVLKVQKANADVMLTKDGRTLTGTRWVSKSGKNSDDAKYLNTLAKEAKIRERAVADLGKLNDPSVIKNQQKLDSAFSLHESTKVLKQDQKAIKDYWNYRTNIERDYARGKSDTRYDAESGMFVGSNENTVRRGEELRKAYDETTKSMSKMGNESERLGALTRLNAEYESKYAAAMDKVAPSQDTIRKTIADYNDFLSKSSASKHGVTSKNHEAIVQSVKDLEALDKQYGKMSPGEAGRKFQAITDSFSKNKDAIVDAGEATDSFGGKITAAVKKYAQYFGISRAIIATVRTIKQMANASIEVESAMNRIQIVTGASDTEMKSFFTAASSQAQELGKSITDVASSIETFSRLGYNLKDASELSKYATIMSNVADTDVGTATTGITSIIKGYSMDASDAEHVSDVLVNVGQKYAISAEELMAAFERGGAALAASGTDFEKSAALFAATNASLQNAQTTGTMWKTVSARIRGAKTELESMGEDTSDLAEGFSKYRDEIQALTGVDIMKNEKEYKDLYDIFTELASVWDNINGDEAKARVAEILGGTRQLSGIMSTITNIKDAQGAYADAMDSAGVSMRANDKHMETTAAHIGKLKATFQDFSSDLFASSFLKGFVDTGNTALKILDSLVEKFGILGTTLGAIGIIKGIKSISNGISAFRSAGAAATSVDFMSAAFPRTFNALVTGGKSLPISPLALAGVAGGVAALTATLVALNNYYKQFDKAQKNATEAITRYEETKSKLESVQGKLSENKNEIAQIKQNKDLTKSEKTNLENLEHENWQLERQEQLYTKLSDIQSKAASQEAKNALSKKTSESLTESEAGSFSFASTSRSPAMHRRKVASTKRAQPLTPIEQIRSYTNDIEKAQDALDATYEKISKTDNEEELELLNKNIESQTKDLEKLETKRAELIDKITPDIEAIRNEDPNDRYVKEFDSLIGQITAKTSAEKLDAFFTGHTEIRDYLQSAADKGKNLEEALRGIGLSLQDVGASSLKELEQQFEGTANSAKKASESTKDFMKDVRDVESAMESDNQDKNWSTLQEAYKTAKEMNKVGKTGTDEYQTMAQILSPNNLKKAAQQMVKAGGYASEAYQKAFEGAMKIGDRWLGESEEKSVDNFIMDFKNKGLFDVTTDSKGLWHLATNFNTTAEAAEKFGVSAQLVDTMLDSLEAYGYDFEQNGRKVERSGEMLSEYSSKLEQLKQIRDSMEYGESRDRLDSIIEGYDEEYDKFQEDLTQLDAEAVIKIKFEYDLASIQKKIDEIQALINGGDNSVETNASLIATQGSYIATAEAGTGIDKATEKASKDGIKLPVMFEATSGSVASIQKQMQDATGDKKIELQGELINAQQIQMGLLDAFRAAHPEVTPDMDPSLVLQKMAEFSNQDITFTATIDGEPTEVTLHKDGTITYKADTKQPDGYTPAPKTSYVNFKVIDSDVRAYTPPNKTATVYYSQSEASKRNQTNSQRGNKGKGAKSNGGSPVDGTAHSRGTAFANGNWGTKGSGTALGGELGTELLVRNGRWFTIGENGAEFFRYKKNDIIFNADQTRQLFEKGKIRYGSRRGSALAEGTAFLRGPGAGSSSSTKKKTTAKSGGGSSKKDAKSIQNALETLKKWLSGLFDWIEIKLERQAAKIDRYTSLADRAADHGRASQAERFYKNAVSASVDKLRTSAYAQKKYQDQANLVLIHAREQGLITKAQADAIRAQDASGALKIDSGWSDALQEVVSNYKTWADKARDAAKEVQELSASITEYYISIADAYRDATNNAIDLLEQKSGNAQTAAGKNKHLDEAAKKYDSIVTKDQAALDALTSQYDSDVRRVTGTANSKITTGTKYKKLSKNPKNTIARVINAAKSCAKKGDAIPAGHMAEIKKYWQNGWIDGNFYISCLQYNETRENTANAKAALKAQLEIDKQTAIQEKDAIGQEKLKNVQEEHERKLDKIGANRSLLESQQGTRTTQGYRLQASDYQNLISYTRQEYAGLVAERDALNAIMQDNVENGLWTTTSIAYQEAIIQVKELESKIQDCLTEQEEFNNAIAELPYRTIEDALELLDSIADYNKSISDLKSSKSLDLAVSDYVTQMEDNNSKIAEYEKRALQAYNDLQLAQANGGYYAGKTADEYEIMFNQAKKDINDLRSENERLKDSLRDDVYWRNFERAHDAAERLQKVVSGLADLISDDMYFKNGRLTEFGVAQIGNLTKQYELAREEVQNYSNDIMNLNELYSQGQYTTLEYKEKLGELQEGLLDAAKDMKNYIDSIISMYKDLDQAELDALFKLIDARSDALDKKKEYYEYDKTIRSKSKDIQELTAQIAALEGVTTSEAKAQRAKLKEELVEAQEDLADTEKEHYFDLSQEGLSNLKDTLQEQFDDKWDNLGSDLTRMIELLTAANELSTQNAAAIQNTLTNLLAFYGINAQETGIDDAFASGTRRVNGRKVALSNESGSELIVTKNGLISHFKPGDGVVPANLTERLYNLAQSVKPNASLGNTNLSKLSSSAGMTVNQKYDSLIKIEGSADAATVADLKQMSKDLLELSYDYTSKRMNHDYVRTGGLRRA